MLRDLSPCIMVCLLQGRHDELSFVVLQLLAQLDIIQCFTVQAGSRQTKQNGELRSASEFDVLVESHVLVKNVP